MSWRVLIRAIPMALMLTVVLAGSAYAGKYHAYACRTPLGEVAPASGWTGSLSKEHAYDDYAINTCAGGGGLLAALGEESIHGSYVDTAMWTFEVPTKETMTAATLWRAGYVKLGVVNEYTYIFWLEGNGHQISECNYDFGCRQQGSLIEPLAAENRVAVPTGDLGTLSSTVNCVSSGSQCPHGSGEPHGYVNAEYIYASDIVLEQTEGPSSSEVGGPLATEKPVHGTSDLTFKATDPASGVYEAVFNVDGSVVQHTVVNENEGHCKNVGETTDGLPAFLYVQPCPKSVSADVGFDTTKVSNGLHKLIVTVTDPAGNSATVLDREIEVSNSGIPVNTAAPTITGIAQQGLTLTAHDGSWTNEPTSFTYQWQRCNATGGECSNISSATSETYTQVEADVEHTLVVSVTATNSHGSASAPSAVTSEVRPRGWSTLPIYSTSFGSSGSGNGQFAHPGDVVVDAKGNLWVIDHNNNRVEEFNEKREYVKAFGSEGTGNGQLKRPDALALDAKGNVWVADTGNSRVEEFNEKGEYVKTFGSSGSGNGQLSEPEGVAIDTHGNIWASDTYNGRLEEFNEKGEYVKIVKSENLTEPEGITVDSKGHVWVADWAGNRIVEFNEEGGYLSKFGSEGTGNGQLKHPYGIAVDASGNVWVGDTNNNRIEVFGEKGEYLSKFGSAGSGAGQFNFSYPIGLAVGSNGNVWITDPNNNRVEEWALPPFPPAYSTSFGSLGSGNGQFSHPGDVVVDVKGNLWVVDHNNNRIEEFNEKREYVKAFGATGSGNGQLKGPDALAIDAKGNVWVADTGNIRVEEFNEKGEYVKTFGSEGSGNGQFKAPEGIAVDPHGNVWVSDTYNGRLEEFNEKGEYVKIVGSKGSGTGQIGESEGIAIDSSSNVWVADWANNRIEEFNEKGEYVREFGSEGSANGQIRRPYGIAVDASGNVWVGDTNNNRIDVFNEKGEYVIKFGSSGSGAGQFSFSYPIGVAVDPSGNVWITDPNNNRVEEWLR